MDRQVFWFDDDDLQRWQNEILEREIYGYGDDGALREDSEGEVEEDLQEPDAEESLGSKNV